MQQSRRSLSEPSDPHSDNYLPVLKYCFYNGNVQGMDGKRVKPIVPAKKAIKSNIILSIYE